MSQPSSEITLSQGESIEIGGQTITFTKAGTKDEGRKGPTPTVTLTITAS